MEKERMGEIALATLRRRLQDSDAVSKFRYEMEDVVKEGLITLEEFADFVVEILRQVVVEKRVAEMKK